MGPLTEASVRAVETAEEMLLLLLPAEAVNGKVSEADIIPDVDADRSKPDKEEIKEDCIGTTADVATEELEPELEMTVPDSWPPLESAVNVEETFVAELKDNAGEVGMVAAESLEDVAPDKNIALWDEREDDPDIEFEYETWSEEGVRPCEGTEDELPALFAEELWPVKDVEPC